MAVEILAGWVPGWALRGYGYGYGYGSGYGSGYGDGDGSGDGYGYGYGDGSPECVDVERSMPSERRTITAKDLRAAAACSDQVRTFERTFPEGGVYPDDLPAAVAAGLDIAWGLTKFGLPPILTTDVAA